MLNDHPKVDTDATSEPDCSPHPFDLMAVYAHLSKQDDPRSCNHLRDLTSGLELTQVNLSAAAVDNLTPPYNYEWSSGPWNLAFSPSNTSSLVSVILPDVDSHDPVQERRVTIEVKVTDANGKVGRDQHVITVQ